MAAPQINKSDDELVIEHGERLVHVCLNRPQALNALSSGMIAGLSRVLDEAENRTILVHGAGRAFCAGGDIKAQVQAIRDGDLHMSASYFRDEYALNANLFDHPGAYVSYLNGITMGGGYGISAHGTHLVACHDTRFAMPEVKIGFFPDVGAVWHLARLADEMGTYLALTGNTIGPADMLALGLVHAFVPQEKFALLRDRLASGADVDDVLEDLHEDPTEHPALDAQRACIAKCFAHDEAEAIVDALRHEGSAFAVATAEEIESRSPTSVKVALAHLRRAGDEDFGDVIGRDMFLALRFLENPDFMEGVRAAVIDKDRNPRWNPADLKGVTAASVALYLG